MDDLVADFFRYEGLLGNALLFFFRECLRRDERLKTTQALLQREGLCVTVQDIQNELKAVKAQISKALDDDSPITEFALRRDQLKKAEITWQTRHAELIQFNQRFENQLGELLSWAENIYFALEEIQDDVKETKAEVKETKNLVEEILDKVTALLARQNVSAQIKPRDEFTHHNSRSLELIQEVFSQLKQVSSKTPQYYRASILAI